MDTKVCKTCGASLPASSEFFYVSRGKYLNGECKSCQKKRSASWAQDNTDKVKDRNREYCRKFRLKHHDEIVQRRRASGRDKLYRDKHKGDDHIRELSRLRRQRRRARKRNCESTFTQEQWELVQIEFEGRCAYCGRETRLTQDHFVPLFYGGAYTSDNIVPACSWCNTSKCNHDFDEWYQAQPFFSEDRRRHILNYLGKEIAV